MGAPLRISRFGAVAEIRLDRPEIGNVIDVAMAEALLEAAQALAEDASVGCLILTGAGPMFCAGGDVRAFAAAPDPGALIDEITSPLHRAIVLLAEMNKPLVTAINGAAAGAGLGLALLGDVAIAARSAKFAVAYGALGLTPDAGTSWLLPRLVGLRQAQLLTLSGARIDAAEAERIGLVTRVVDDDQLRQEAEATAERLSLLSGAALRRTRALLHASHSNDLATHLEQEARAIATSARERDGREGVAAFLAKRKPRFGRR